MTTLTKNQQKTYGPRIFDRSGKRYRITAEVRHDDRCGNGQNTFSITATIDREAAGRWVEDSGGCLHEEVAKHFPELAPFIKWHLTSTDGPMHYIANTLFHADDRDHNGLRKGETRQIRNGKSGQLAWILEPDGEMPPKHLDADERPAATVTLRYAPWVMVGEGKERDLDAARRCAVWTDATDEELTAPDLRERLQERLPALMAEFQAAVESLGFTY